MNPDRLPPALRRGQLLRLAPDGPCHTVVRITESAAYVKQGDWTTADGSVLAGLENGVEAISLHSFVYPFTYPDPEENVEP